MQRERTDECTKEPGQLRTATIHRVHLARRVVAAARKRYEGEIEQQGAVNPQGRGKEREEVDHATTGNLTFALPPRLNVQDSSAPSFQGCAPDRRVQLDNDLRALSESVRVQMKPAEQLPAFDLWKYITHQELKYLRLCTHRIRAMVLREQKFDPPHGPGRGAFARRMSATAKIPSGIPPQHPRTAASNGSRSKVQPSHRPPSGHVPQGRPTSSSAGRPPRSRMVGLLRPLIPRGITEPLDGEESCYIVLASSKCLYAHH